jgi:hypothetical protein
MSPIGLAGAWAWFTNPVCYVPVKYRVQPKDYKDLRLDERIDQHGRLWRRIHARALGGDGVTVSPFFLRGSSNFPCDVAL